MHAFLSYASEDRPQVRSVWRFLRDHGVPLWYDEESLRPGEDWAATIRSAIESASLFLACLSSTSIAKRGHVQVELKEALDVFRSVPEGDVYLIPVRLNECELPPSLRRFHAVDLFRDGGEAKLLEGVRHCIPMLAADGAEATQGSGSGLQPGEWAVLMSMKGTHEVAWTAPRIREAMTRRHLDPAGRFGAELDSHIRALAERDLLVVEHDGRVSPTGATIDFWTRQRGYNRQRLAL